MNKKNTTILVSIIVISFVFGISSNVFATKNFNSAKSNTSAYASTSNLSNEGEIKIIYKTEKNLQKDRKPKNKNIRSFFNRLIPTKRENIRSGEFNETGKNIRDKKQSGIRRERLDKKRDELNKRREDISVKKRELEERLNNAKTPEERDAIKREIDKGRENLKDKRSEKRSALKDRRNEKRKEIRKKLGEKAKKRIGAYIDRIAKRFNAVLDRFKKIGNRIDTRINKLEDKGVNVSATRGALANARDEIASTRDNVAKIINAARDAINSENPRESFKEIRGLIGEAKDSIKKAHKALVEAIKELKASSKTKPKNKEQDTTATDETGNNN